MKSWEKDRSTGEKINAVQSVAPTYNEYMPKSWLHNSYNPFNTKLTAPTPPSAMFRLGLVPGIYNKRK
jgi:hypothetical protein